MTSTYLCIRKFCLELHGVGKNDSLIPFFIQYLPSAYYMPGIIQEFGPGNRKQL